MSSSTHSDIAPPIAGRARELADIDSVLASARSGQCRVVLLSGEPGIGKTRILAHAARQGHHENVLVLRGNCYEDAAMAPYGPFVEVLHDLLRQFPDAIEVVDRQYDLSALAVLAPHLRLEHRDGTFNLLSEAERRHRLFDAYGRLLVTVGSRRPLVLVIDDLHWADLPSANLLRHVTRALRHSPAAVLCAYRDTDLDQGGPFERVLMDLTREHIARRIALRRLDASATAEIFARVLEAPVEQVAPRSVETIQRKSEGVPFFVEELTLHLREEGVLRPGMSGRWDLERESESLAPRSVRGVISRRLARLDPASSELLAVAAVSGREFRPAVVREVASRRGIAGGEHVVTTLREAVDRRLLVVREQSYVFAHEQIREVLYQSLNPIRRRQLHQLTAEAIERHEGDEPRLASRLAYHYSHGDDLARALRFTIMAAEDAQRVHAVGDATRLYSNALDILDLTGGPDAERQRFAVLLARDVALAAAGATQERPAGIRAMLDISEHIDDHAVIQARLQAALYFVHAGGGDAAVEHARRAVQLAGGDPSPRRLVALMALGQALVMRPMGEPSPLDRDCLRVAEAVDIFRTAFEIADVLEDRLTCARIAQEIGVLESSSASDDCPEMSERAHAWLLRALELFRSAGDRKGEVTSLIALAYRRSVTSSSEATVARESYVSFLEEIRRLRATEHRLSRTSERPRMDALALLSIELYCRSNGWYEGALQRAGQALVLADEAHDARVMLMARTALSETERILGRIHRAIEHAEQVMAAIDSDGGQRGGAHVQHAAGLSLAAAHALAGNDSRALDLVNDGVQRAAFSGPAARLAEALAAQAEVAEVAGDVNLAGEAARQALRVAIGMAGGITWDIRAELVLARLALRSGDVNLALGHASAAAGRLAQQDLSLIALNIAVDLVRGRALLAAGFDSEARESLSSASLRVRRIAERFTEPTLRDTFMSRSQLATTVATAVEQAGLTMAHPLVTRQTGVTPGTLTKREIEVLRQVAAGLSNREIADRLYISEKTVARHLTNTFTKLDVESRTQAAAWAFRQGIA